MNLFKPKKAFIERFWIRFESCFFHKNPFIKVMYGRLPDQFADYWMTRFPKLLIHSWMAMHCIKREPSLAKYFDKDYDFVKVSDLLYSVYSVCCYATFHMYLVLTYLSTIALTSWLLTLLEFGVTG